MGVKGATNRISKWYESKCNCSSNEKERRLKFPWLGADDFSSQQEIQYIPNEKLAIRLGTTAL